MAPQHIGLCHRHLTSVRGLPGHWQSYRDGVGGEDVAKPVSAYDYVFPVVGGDHAPRAATGGPAYLINQVYGTAFCLAENYFVTNEHVIRNASANTWWGIAFPDEQRLKAVPVDHHESFSSIDIGILSAAVPKAKHLKWCSDELAMLTNVQASGFPHALDLSELTLTIRSFPGTVVSAKTWSRLPAKPRVYELSFLCPRGISGSPLWRVGGTLPCVVGVVFGNSITEMIVHKEVEKVKEGDKTTIYEKVEALHLGLAIQVQSLLSVESSLLGMHIGDFLRTHSLLEGT